MSDQENEVSETELEKAIRQIRKLVSRAKGNESESEADSSMAIAQKIMSKYNLDMAAIEAATGSTDTTRTKEEAAGRTKYKWQRELAQSVAEANFCFHMLKSERVYIEGYYIDRKTEIRYNDRNSIRAVGQDPDEEIPDPKDVYDCVMRFQYVEGRRVPTMTHVFVGRKANLITAQLMFTYLCETIEKLAPFDNDQRLSKSAFSWKTGAAERVCERLADRRKDLIERHDARVQAEREATRIEFEKRAKAKEASTPKALEGNEGAEVKSKIGNMKAGSRNRVAPIPEADEPDRPEPDEKPFNPSDLEEQPEPVTETAMVLASVYDETEQEANYELAHDLKPGTLARQRKAKEEREAQWAKEDAEEAAAAAKEEINEVEKPVKEETERQLQARLNREAKERAKNRARWAREDDRAQARATKEYYRLDRSAYQKGSAAGKSIGLDGQVKARADQKALKGRE